MRAFVVAGKPPSADHGSRLDGMRGAAQTSWAGLDGLLSRPGIAPDLVQIASAGKATWRQNNDPHPRARPDRDAHRRRRRGAGQRHAPDRPRCREVAEVTAHVSARLGNLRDAAQRTGTAAETVRDNSGSLTSQADTLSNQVVDFIEKLAQA